MAEVVDQSDQRDIEEAMETAFEVIAGDLHTEEELHEWFELALQVAGGYFMKARQVQDGTAEGI